MSDAATESERLRQQAERRRRRVLENQRSRIEAVGGDPDSNAEVPHIYTPGAKPVSASSSWIKVIQGFSFIAVFPLALVAALLSFRDTHSCWSPGFEDEVGNPVLSLLLRLTPSRVSPLSLFVSLQVLAHGVPWLLQPAHPPSRAPALLSSLGLPPPLATLGQALFKAYSVGSALVGVFKDFCLYLVLWKLFSLMLNLMG
eukprot:Gregarina_sp_Pseudo_9__2520@NODE_2796_length_870_cov_69_148014_g2559_i0_p2_GENE_NODE_2796_length_870_cov_69_148014_g2559_i0NODE_2796_length_870_cov_69_148014_g2559_i0_p2_ORF_typecomplete_len200_score53_77CAML/PF14963_6/0_17CAML/PF14963_6/2_2e02GET2/PF08690_10/1_7e03GET2/PF08690_10/0_044_NODE_2796_length_870_cov_69_148014_g2559_i034633